jgi:hypothetical protein
MQLLGGARDAADFCQGHEASSFADFHVTILIFGECNFKKIHWRDDTG